jgi:hypothetical protein
MNDIYYYDVGVTVGAIYQALLRRPSVEKIAATAELSYGLKGQLYKSSAGWILLTVPNHLGRGAFDALGETGIELPLNSKGIYNAHISVMRPEEVETIPGGAGAISERGHDFAYTLGPVRSVKPHGWSDVAKVWYIEVHSPQLEQLRRSYGLSSRPRENKHRFHITIAIRKSQVLRENDKSKAASFIHYPEEMFRGRLATAGPPQLAEDAFPCCDAEAETGETIKTGEEAIAAPKGELCPYCQARLEYNPDDQTCNHCGKEYPPEKLAAESAGLHPAVAQTVQQHGQIGPGFPYQSTIGHGKVGPLMHSDAGLDFLHHVHGDAARAGLGQSLRRSGYDPTSEQATNVGQQLFNQRWPTQLPPVQSGNVSQAAGVGVQLAPGSFEQSLYGMPAHGILNHELEHVRQDRVPGGGAGVEVGPSLGDLVFANETARQVTGQPTQHQVTFPSGKEHDINWMTDQAKQHGYFGGKSMDDLLATPAGQQWLQQAIGEKGAGLLPSVHLQPQQQRVSDEIKHQRVRKLLYHSLGSGKTLSSIAAAESAGEPYLATVPAALRPNFKNEQARWTDQQTPSEVESYSALAKGVPQQHFGTAIFDEAQRLRNENSLQTQHAKEVARQTPNLLMLSGTPIVNGPGDFAPLAEMLTGKPQDSKTFEQTYVGQKTVRPSLMARFRGVQPAKVPVLRNQDQLKKLLAGHVDYHAPAKPDVEQVEERYETPMSGEQTKLYQAFWNQLPWVLRWKLQHEFPLSKQEIGNLSSFLAGPRQVSLSTLPFMRGRRDPYKAFQQSPKLQRAMQLAEETLGSNPNAKIVAFSNFLEAGLQPYAAALAAKKIPYAIFHGGMNDAERKRAVADYNANRIRALLIAPAGAEGISLKHTNALQLLDPHWNEARLDQAIGRGIRFDSHTDLPPEQRKVRVQRFLSTLPPGVLSRLWRYIIQTKPNTEKSSPGVDLYLEHRARKKQELNNQFLNLLKEIGSPKAAAATGSYYLDAVQQTPVSYDSSQGALQNLLMHLGKVRARGDRAITEAENWDSLQDAADPNRSLLRLQRQLAGEPPLVSHPLDRLLHA